MDGDEMSREDMSCLRAASIAGEFLTVAVAAALAFSE